MAKLSPRKLLQQVRQKVAFGYHAVVDRHRRTTPRSTTQSEDSVLPRGERKRLIATVREARRNISLVKWAIDQHLDFVTRFRFQPRTGNEELDEKLDKLVRWRSRAKNWDVAGRHDRDRYMRILEGCRVVDGDVGNILLRTGQMQAIEGDRIAKPTQGQIPDPYHEWTWTHGIHTTAVGKPTHYMICGRSNNSATSLTYQSVVRAKNFRLLGYWDRFDQLRGISPLACALNTAVDISETLEAQSVRQKMLAMFGLFIKRESAGHGDGYVYTDDSTGDTPTSTTTEYNFELKPGLKMEGRPGDSIDTIESKSPSNEFQAFTELEAKFVLLSLGIPYTFYDSRESSYSAMRQDLVRYQKTVEDQRHDLRVFLRDITALDIARWANTPDKEAADGSMILPLPQGLLPRDVEYAWVADGIPWIDPVKESVADATAVANGFKSRDDVCRERRGTRFVDVVTELGAEEAKAIEVGATIAIGMPGQMSTRDEEEGNKANTGDDDEQ